MSYRDSLKNIRRLSGLCIVWAAIVTLAIAPNVVAADSSDIRVASFNVRFARPGHSEAKSQDNWADAKTPRRERTIRVIHEMEPDILGVQEIRSGQIRDLRSALPEFAFYGIGRDDGKKAGEFSGIFYRKDRFERQDAGSFWLSDTPDKPGTTFYKAKNAVPRIASWLRLRDKSSGREIFVLNAHWDHIDVPAREKSAVLMRKNLVKLAPGLPAIVMGDFNSPEDSPAFAKLIPPGKSQRIQLADSYRELHPERTKEESTYNDWNGRIQGSRIDFILHTPEFRPISAEIIRTSYDGLYPSDHYPVTATLRLGADP